MPSVTGTPDDPDAADVAGAAAGDTRAFERLYYRHAARIQTLARRIVGRELADEATHEVFVRAWERLGQFRGNAMFGTWLHRVAVNALLRHAEVARRILRRSAPLEDVTVASAVLQHDLVLDVDDALGRLGPGLREVVVLHDMEGYSHDEIGAAIGISVSASKMRLHRGRMLLRELLIR